MKSYCTYDNSYDLKAEKWVKDNLSVITALPKDSILKYEYKLLKEVNRLNQIAINIEDEKLEDTVGTLYANLFILLNIMISTKLYTRHKPYDPELDKFLGLTEQICSLFSEYSSSNRTNTIRKLTKQL